MLSKCTRRLVTAASATAARDSSSFQHYSAGRISSRIIKPPAFGRPTASHRRFPKGLASSLRLTTSPPKWQIQARRDLKVWHTIYAALAISDSSSGDWGVLGGRSIEFYATCFPGLEEVVASELRAASIGATHVVPAKAGVTFRGHSIEVGYRANLWLRSAIRVMVLMSRGYVSNEQSGAVEIYNFTRGTVEWGDYLYAEDMHFSVTGHAADCSDIRSGLLLSTRIKDAVCDGVRAQNGFKPVPAPKGQSPDLQLFAVAFKDQISLYRNMSGESLHKRGYREAMHKASLNEAIAAGVLLLLGWDDIADQEGGTLADPMCGSGTFLIEAALMAQRRAPGLSREAWPFFKWHDFEEEMWQAAVNDAKRQARPWHGEIWGSDIHEGALWLANRDVEAANVNDIVKLKLGSVSDMYLPRPPTMVVTNPPWGQRLEGDNRAREADSEGLRETWTQLGLFLKRECADSTVGVLNGANKSITRELMLKADCRFPISVGGVDARLLKYSMLPPKPKQCPPSTPRSTSAWSA